MKILKVLSVLLTVLLLCVDCHNGHKNERQRNKEESVTQEIKIGAILPLTGVFSINGQTCKEGLDLAVREINEFQSKFFFMVTYEENHSLSTDNLTAFNKLKVQNYKIFVGFGGQLLSGIIPKTNDQDMILFAHATNNNKFMTTSNRCLRMYPNSTMFANMISDFLDSLSISNAGVVYLNNEAFTEIGETFRAEFESRGHTVPFFEAYDPKSRDFKNIVNKAANKNLQCIYIAGSGETAASFIHQLFSNPNTERIPVMGEMSLSNSSNREVIGDHKTSVYVLDNYMSNVFVENYYNAYKKTPNGYAAYVYANMYMLLDALNNIEEPDGKSLYTYFRENRFDTAIGEFSFDKETGEPDFELLVNELK